MEEEYYRWPGYSKASAEDQAKAEEIYQDTKPFNYDKYPGH